MEKSLKWKDNELLDSIVKELNQDEMNELYKALLAYSLGFTKIDDALEKVLTEVIEVDYFENDNISGILNEELVYIADSKLDDYKYNQNLEN